MDAEPSGVAAGVEHRAALAKRREVSAVVALVAEEAGLVASLEEDAKSHAVLVDRYPRGKLGAGNWPARKVLGQRNPLVHVNTEVPRPQPRREQVKDRADPLIHPQAEDLGRQDVGEAIDDQPGKTVPLGMDDAVGVGHGVEPEHLAAQRHGPIDPTAPEVEPRRVDPRREEPETDLGPAVPEPEPDRKMVAVHHADEIAIGGTDRADRTDHHLAIDERMTPRGADRQGRQSRPRVPGADPGSQSGRGHPEWIAAGGPLAMMPHSQSGGDCPLSDDQGQ